MRPSSVLLALVLATPAACKKDPGPDYVPTLKIWPHSTANGETVSCRGGFCGESALDGGKGVGGDVSLVLNDAGLNARLETSTGDTVTLLGDSVTLGPTQDATFPNALARFADAHALDDWLAVDVKVSTPRGTSVTKKVELEIGSLMEQRIEKAKAGPARFPGETLAESAGKVAYVARLATGGTQPSLVGDGRWRDIDLVAFEDVKWSPGKTCKTAGGIELGTGTKGGVGRGGLGGLGGLGHAGTITTQALHSEVTLFDRRAGKLVDKTSFDSVGECPTYAADAGLAGFSPSSPSNVGAIKAWVQSKLHP